MREIELKTDPRIQIIIGSRRNSNLFSVRNFKILHKIIRTNENKIVFLIVLESNKDLILNFSFIIYKNIFFL